MLTLRSIRFKVIRMRQPGELLKIVITCDHPECRLSIQTDFYSKQQAGRYAQTKGWEAVGKKDFCSWIHRRSFERASLPQVLHYMSGE